MVTVLNNQSLFDLAIQVYGSTRYVFDLALANGLSVTGSLEPGQVLEVPEVQTESGDVQRYYEANGIKPSTSLRPEDMAIGNNDSCNYCKLFE